MITSILISAPRLINSHRLLMSSICEMAATLAVAAKKVRPLVRMLWLHCSTEMWAASFTVRPFCSSSLKRVVVKMA